jgi:LEA14-like dessication related protein
MAAAAKHSNVSNGLGLVALGVGGWLVYDKIIRPRMVIPAKLVQASRRWDIRLVGVRFRGDNIDLDFYLQNPNVVPMTINAIVGKIWLTSQAKTYNLGDVAKYGNLVIKPTAETKVPVTVRSRFLGLLPYFTDMVQGKIKNQLATFKGTVTIDGVPYPITKSYRIS